MLELGDIPLFSKLPPNALEDLGELIERRSLPAHTIICRKGEPGQFLYVVASGGVNVSIGSTQDRNRVFLGPGELFGEMSLLTGMPASATAISAKDTQLYLLSEKAFQTLLKTQPQLHHGLIEMLVDRLRSRSGAGPASLSPICCFLITQAETSMRESLLAGLHSAICRYSPESYLLDSTQSNSIRNNKNSASSPTRIPGFFPYADKPVRPFRLAGNPVAKGFAFNASADWCRNLVRNWRTYASHDQVLVLALSVDDFSTLDLNPLPQDAILAVSDAASLNTYETLANKSKDQADFGLAVIGDEDRQNGNTTASSWRFRIPKDELTRVEARLASPEPGHHTLPALEWIARWVTKREVGLSLSAGAARGFAHLGVLKVLEDASIPIDCITGTSIGGIVSLVYAMTGNAEESISILRESLGSNKKVRDVTLFPRSSLYGGRKVKRAALEFFGDMQIPDLIKPCAVVAADLVNGERHVMDRGPAREAALATSAIPGLFPPIEKDGRLLSDGAVMNRLPLDLLQQRRCGFRIAVNVIPSPEARKQESKFTAGWLNDRFSRLFGFKHVMSVSWELQAWNHSASEALDADIFIEPDTIIYSGYDFDRFDQMVDAGRRAAEEKLELIQIAAENSLRPNALSTDTGHAN